MKRFLLLIVSVIICSSVSYGQKIVRGTITESISGYPVGGVKIKTSGPFPSMSIDSTIKGSLTTSSLKQIVTGQMLNPSFQTNINNLLAGKVTGLKINGQSEMALGRTGSITLHGQGGLAVGTNPVSIADGKVPYWVSNNYFNWPAGFFQTKTPVYIVDGTILSDINDINYIEIDSVTVLSGPASSARFGSKGAYGVVLITTKKGTTVEQRGEVEVNSGIEFSDVNVLPEYQNSYAGGNVSDMYKYLYRPGIDPVEWAPLDGKFYPDYSDDSSWGPRMAGQEYIPWYSWYPGTKYTGTTAELNPQPDNVRDFYNTGLTISNNISFSKSVSGFSIRAYAGENSVKGLIPYTSLEKNNFGIRTSFEIYPGLDLEANINFFSRLQKGEIDDNYSNQSTGMFNSWFHRDLDMKILKELKDVRTDYGPYAIWNHNNPTAYDPLYPLGFFSPNYWLNSYKYFDLIDIIQRSDRLYGNITLKYSIIDGVKLKFIYRRQETNSWSETKVPQMSYSGLQSSYSYRNGYYSTGTAYSNLDIFENVLTLSKRFKRFSLNSDIGTEFYSSILKTNSANTSNGLLIPGLYTISNSRDHPYIINSRFKEKQRSFFMNTTIGYKNILFADVIVRKEYHSTLPPEHNSITSGSLGGAFIFSELIHLPYLNFGKIRYSWGVIPTAIGIFAYPGISFPTGQYQWNNNYLASTPDQLVASDITGSTMEQNEKGIDLELFRSRAGISITYWTNKETEIPCNRVVSGYSGFTYKIVNTGRIDKSGIDLSIRLTPVSLRNIDWQTSFVFSKLIKNKIIQIAEGVEKISVQAQWTNADGSARAGTPAIIQMAGKSWGDLVGSGMKVNNKGLPCLNSDGSYVPVNKNFGSVVPGFTGGLQNSIRLFKKISINFNIDYQAGGKFFSLSEMWGAYNGITAITAGLNDKGNPVRDPVIDGGGVHVSGVDENTGSPVDYYVNASDYFHNMYDMQIYDFFVHDASYVKLREISLAYKIPVGNTILKSYLSDITVSFFARNLWLIYSAQSNFDPSELSYISGEQAQFPGVRTLGMNIRMIF